LPKAQFKASAASVVRESLRQNCSEPSGVKRPKEGYVGSIVQIRSLQPREKRSTLLGLCLSASTWRQNVKLFEQVYEGSIL
jgi:hypothetical protein